MNVSAATVLLFVFQLIHYAQFLIFKQKNDDTSNDLNDSSREENETLFINGSKLDFLYCNSILGNNKSIEIKFGNESSVLDHWIDDLPLKVITHGWYRGSRNNFTGVFIIKTAYIDTGGYNVISVQWNRIAGNKNYIKQAILTLSIGKAIAEFLDNMITHTGTKASDIHLIGHSLGAHVMGSCSSYFKSGKIGRITGLDPASIGFECIPIQKERLNIDDAEFVDVIHTALGILGYMERMGHVDFYPNGGVAPQPGYKLLKLAESFSGSHSRSYFLYADSLYYRNSFVATQCDSWSDFNSNKCENNTKILMGHDTITSARGKFYLKTEKSSPFGIY